MNLEDIDLRELYRNWKYGLKEFRGFLRSTPFVSLQVYDDFTLKETELHINQDDLNNLLKDILLKINEKCFCIIDLPFGLMLNLAVSLNNDYEIKPVLNVNMVFNEYGLVGSRENISTLIYNSLKLKKIKSDKFIMMFDYNRYNDEIDFKNIYDRLNNQYSIGDDDFPGGKFLKDLGYNKIAVFTSKSIKEDLKIQLDFIEKEMEVEIIEVSKIE